MTGRGKLGRSLQQGPLQSGSLFSVQQLRLVGKSIKNQRKNPIPVLMKVGSPRKGLVNYEPRGTVGCKAVLHDPTPTFVSFALNSSPEPATTLVVQPHVIMYPFEAGCCTATAQGR